MNIRWVDLLRPTFGGWIDGRAAHLSAVLALDSNLNELNRVCT
jgi:hypothetical protein